MRNKPRVLTAFESQVTIAEVFVRGGKIGEAVTVVRGMQSYYQHPAFLRISRTLVSMRRTDEALEIANNFASDRHDIFIALVRYLVKQGDDDGARRGIDMTITVARRNPGAVNQPIFTAIIDLLARKFNDTEKALELARDISPAHPYSRSLALTIIAMALADAGRTAEAQTLLEESSALAELIVGEDDRDRSEIYARIVTAQAKLHHFYEARQTAERCKTVKIQAASLNQHLPRI